MRTKNVIIKELEKLSVEDKELINDLIQKILGDMTNLYVKNQLNLKQIYQVVGKYYIDKNKKENIQ